MKLLNLHIESGFRSLQPGFKIEFTRLREGQNLYEFAPYCFVGPNGSGKSNVLEAIAAIFYHVELINLGFTPKALAIEQDDKPERESSLVQFKAEESYPDAYTIEYLIPLPIDLATKTLEQLNGKSWTEFFAHIIISKKINERPIVQWVNRKQFDENGGKVLARKEIKLVLPEIIVGYSSGENEILSLPFFKMRFIHFDEYVDRLTRKMDYSAPEGRMVYLDNQFSQAIFLCNYLFEEEVILKTFREELNISGITKFRLIIRNHHRFNYNEDVLTTLDESDRKQDSEITVDITDLISKEIDNLKRCATTYSIDTETSSLILDYYLDLECRKAFLHYFSNSYNLFKTLQVLITLNQYQVKDETKEELYYSKSIYVNETVPEIASEERIFRFKDLKIIKKGVKEILFSKSLSDGEHQFLHSIGLCILLRNKPALILLDEPETHLNPSWRSQFISTIKQCLESSEKIMQEVLITTHSPFIVSDCKSENVFVFTKNQRTSKIAYARPLINTYGASINQIMIRVFDKDETISGLANIKFSEIKASFIKGKISEKDAISEANTLGDSVEKLLLIDFFKNYKPLKKIKR